MAESEMRINPELLTLREQLFSETDKKWYWKVHPEMSETGGFLSLAAGGTSADFASQLTKTDLLSGNGTLTSAGMRFLLRTFIVRNGAAKANTVTLYDSTGKKMVVNLTSAGTTNSLFVIQGYIGKHFSTDCRVGATTGPVAATVGGLRLALLV